MAALDEGIGTYSKWWYVAYLQQMRWQNIKKRGGLNNKKLFDQRDWESDIFKQVRLLKSCFIYALFKRKS